MRSKLLAASACLLAAAPAFGQPPAATLAPTATVVDDAPAVDLSGALGGSPWRMNGPRAYGSVDYLLWWVRPQSAPNLIQSVPSALAQTSTTLAPGAARPVFPENGRIDFGSFSGVRGTLGVNFDRFGLEGTGFYLGRQTTGASLASNGRPFAVAVPYTSAGSGQNTALFASLPDQYSGSASVSADTRVWGAEGNVRLPFFVFLTENTDALVGFRYFDLDEGLRTNFRAQFPEGRTIDIRDAIRTENHFYGGQVGLNGRVGGMDRGLGWDGTAKMALGGVNQRVELTGSNTIADPGAPPSTEAGGLYARGANQGTFERDKFAAVFSLDSNLTYNFNARAQVYVGYSIIWISSVVRPGEQIDQVVNDSRTRFVANPTASTANRPAFEWRASDFFTQGITFGAKLQY